MDGVVRPAELALRTHHRRQGGAKAPGCGGGHLAIVLGVARGGLRSGARAWRRLWVQVLASGTQEGILVHWCLRTLCYGTRRGQAGRLGMRFAVQLEQ